MLPYFYQELFGAAVFLGGLWLVFRDGELSFRGRRARWLIVLLAGFVLLALLQGSLQWIAQP